MSNAKRLRLVVDTNLIVSAALIPQSLPDKLVKTWLQDLFDLATSKEQLEEIKTASKKERLKAYPVFVDRITELTQNLEFAAELVKPISETNLPLRSRDPKDDYILAVSLCGKANYLVTGDKDLLILSNESVLGLLKIVTVEQFLSKIIH